MSVEELLRGAWMNEVAPHVRPDACILAARCSKEVLRYFGIDSKVLTVGVMAANERAVELIEAKLPVDEWPEDAWSVGVSVDSPNPDPSKGWSGHAVVVTDGFVVDLTAPQVDRPGKGIVTGGPLVVAFDRLEAVVWREIGMKYGVKIPIESGVYVWGREKNEIPTRTSRDWRSNYRPFSGKMIRWIRARI